MEGPQYHPQPHPLHSTTGTNPHAMAEMGKLDYLEERLRAIEGGEDYAFANLEELFLVPNIITPPKFKVSDFDKYKGTTCPKNHLKMYCWKMGAYTKDEELLIHFFQESLTEVAITWYNFDMAPDRMQLQNMCKKGQESFKEYAQRWRDLATPVAPPMVEKEMITIIVDMLPVFYYEKMVGYVPSIFVKSVFASKRIKAGLKRGKFDHPALMNEKTGANEEGENEGETHAATVVPTWKIPHQHNNIITQPILALHITHHPVIHKGHP